jgi:hypothetical protein
VNSPRAILSLVIVKKKRYISNATYSVVSIDRSSTHLGGGGGGGGGGCPPYGGIMMTG